MKVAVFSGGEYVETKLLPYDKLICADKGYEYALNLGLTPDLTLGDFDSLGYQPKNAEIYPVHKNYSDTQLAVIKALELGATEIDLYFTLGGRIDHELFNIDILSFCKNKGVKASIINGKTYITLIDGKGDYPAKAGETVSLLPFSSVVHIIKSDGLKYSLDNLTAVKGETLTLSNVALKSSVHIEVESGELLYISFL